MLDKNNKKIFENIHEAKLYMSEEAYSWLGRNIAQLEAERDRLNDLINELRDPGTLRPDAASLDTENRLLQVGLEISEKKSHLANAIIVRAGDQIDGYTLGTFISVRFADEIETENFRIGTFYDALMSRDAGAISKIIYYKAPLLKGLKELQPGKKYSLDNGTEIKVPKIQES